MFVWRRSESAAGELYRAEIISPACWSKATVRLLHLESLHFTNFGGEASAPTGGVRQGSPFSGNKNTGYLAQTKQPPHRTLQ